MPRRKATKGRGRKKKKVPTKSPTPKESDNEEPDIDIDLDESTKITKKSATRKRKKKMMENTDEDDDTTSTSSSTRRRVTRRTRRSNASDETKNDPSDDENKDNDDDDDDDDDDSNDETNTVEGPSELHLEIIEIDNENGLINTVEKDHDYDVQIVKDEASDIKLKNITQIKELQLRGHLTWLQFDDDVKRVRISVDTYVKVNRVIRPDDSVIDSYPDNAGPTIQSIAFVHPPYLADMASQRNLQMLQTNYLRAKRLRSTEGHYYPLLFREVFAVICDPGKPKYETINGNEVQMREMQIWDRSGKAKLRMYPASNRIKKLFFDDTKTDYRDRIIQMDNVSHGNKNGVQTAARIARDGLVIVAGKIASITVLDQREADLEKLITECDNNHLRSLLEYIQRMDGSRNDQYHIEQLIRPRVEVNERPSTLATDVPIN